MTRREYFCAMLSAVLPKAANGAGGAARRLAVIVHPSNRFDSLSSEKVSYLFLKKVSRWPWGAEALPAELAKGATMRDEFLRQVLRLTEEELEAYWIDQRTTRGVVRPLQFSCESARAWVAAKPGGIAYVPASAVDRTVKELRVDW